MKTVGAHTPVADLTTPLVLTVPANATKLQIQAFTQNAGLSYGDAVVSLPFIVEAGKGPYVFMAPSNEKITISGLAAGASITYQFFG